MVAKVSRLEIFTPVSTSQNRCFYETLRGDILLTFPVPFKYFPMPERTTTNHPQDQDQRTNQNDHHTITPSWPSWPPLHHHDHYIIIKTTITPLQQNSYQTTSSLFLTFFSVFCQLFLLPLSYLFVFTFYSLLVKLSSLILFFNLISLSIMYLSSFFSIFIVSFFSFSDFLLFVIL